MGIEWDIWDGEWEEKGLEIRDGMGWMGMRRGMSREGHGAWMSRANGRVWESEQCVEKGSEPDLTSAWKVVCEVRDDDHVSNPRVW